MLLGLGNAISGWGRRRYEGDFGMSDVKFTPGPWEVVNTDDNLCMSMTVITPRGLFERNETNGMLSDESSDKLGKIIAVTFHQIDPIVGLEACDKNEDDGNARLIASAPEMYESLKIYESWEAELLMENSVWVNGLPRFTQSLYDKWMEIQGKRNEVLGKADGRV